MISTRFISLALLAVAPLACQKSALQQQKEATEAQDKANQVATEQRDKVAAVAASAAQQAADKTAAARDEADKKIAAANRQASDRVNAVVDDANGKIVDAQLAADRQAKQAAETFQKARLDLENGVGKQLDTIDQRTAEVRSKLQNDKHASPAKEASVKQIEAKSKSVRADLQAFETKTARSIESFQAKLEQSLEDLRKSIDKLEAKPEAS